MNNNHDPPDKGEKVPRPEKHWHLLTYLAEHIAAGFGFAAGSDAFHTLKEWIMQTWTR